MRPSEFQAETRGRNQGEASERLGQPQDRGTETKATSLAKKAYARHVLVSAALYLLICRCFPFENSWQSQLVL